MKMKAKTAKKYPKAHAPAAGPHAYFKAALATPKAAGKTKTAPYDVADYLRTPEDQAAYINAWLTDAPDDIAGIARAIGDVARAQGMSKVARDAGVGSRTSLYKAFGDNGNPTFATALCVFRALNIKFSVSAFKPTRAQPRATQAVAAVRSRATHAAPTPAPRPRKRHAVPA